MTPNMRKGLIVALLHVGLVASLGAKLQVDRATRPRVWARTAPVDPNLPIRGRYVRLRIEADPSPDFSPGNAHYVPIALSVKDGRLAAAPDLESGKMHARLDQRDGAPVAVLIEPVAYFIPEHAADPSVRQPGEELWVEVTVPRAGAPRPIRLGVKKDGVIAPLEVR
jgi:uncharacterized membrane-anchored protein